MADNIIKPSIGMMPIDDIAEELKKRDDLISTANLAKALGLETSQLDKIVLSDNSDRNVANDSSMLGGKSADQYVTQDDKEAILDEAKDIMNSNPNEIQLLRDELYALKCELVRDGFIDDTMVADGFIDGFKNTNILYDQQSTEVASISSETNTISQANKIVEKNEYGIFCTEADNEYFLTKATGDTATTTTFASLPSNIEEGTKIVKTLGSYIKGSFSFSSIAEEVPGQERYTVLNDDSNTTEYKLSADAPGIAARVKIPKKCAGRIKRVTVNVSTYGSPGTLKCYVIKDKEPSYAEAETDVLSLAKTNGHLIGESSRMSATDIVDGEITFTILNEDKLYPAVENANYIILIEDSSPTGDSYWTVQAGSKEIVGGDLQTNNITYKYNGTLEPIADADMLYTIVTENITYGNEIAYNKGLYSTSKPIKTLDYMNASRARLTLEINKEGNLKARQSGFTNAIDVDNQNNVLQGGDYVVVGTSFSKILEAKSMQIILEKPVLVCEGDPVYVVSYMPQIETYLEKIDNNNVSTITNHNFFQMSLIGVIPSRNDSTTSKSDRLIFETDGDFGTFNRAKFQIAWNSSANNLSDKYIGRIYNLSLVFDKK